MEKIIKKYLNLAENNYFSVVLQNSDIEIENFDYYTKANITRKAEDYEAKIIGKLSDDYISFFITETTPLDEDHIYSRKTTIEFDRRDSDLYMDKKVEDRINVYDYEHTLIRSQLEKKSKEMKKFKIDEKDLGKSLVSDIKIIKSKDKLKKK